MASYTYEQLKGMVVADLRDIAKGLQSDKLEGYSTMHKDHLLPILCEVMGIHVHHAAQGAQKGSIKSTIRKLKAQRDAAVAAKNEDQAAAIRRTIHDLKRQLRRMAEAAT